MIRSIDNTSFYVDLLDLYYSDVSSYISSNLIEKQKIGTEHKYYFDLLFLTPTNLVSDQFKTYFTVTVKLIDGFKFSDRKDHLGENWTDISDLNSQIAQYEWMSG